MKKLLIATILGIGATSSAFAGKTIFATNNVTVIDPDHSVAWHSALKQAVEASAAQCKGKKATGAEPNSTNITDDRNIGTDEHPMWTVTASVTFECK